MPTRQICPDTEQADSESDAVSLDDVRAAATRIARLIHRTPVVTSRRFNDSIGGHEVFFKCESFQKAGSFKFRGASNAIASLSPEQLQRGVVTHSSGNHAGALACAAHVAGTPCWVVMPAGSSPVKRAAVLAYGGRVVTCENNERARTAVADEVQRDTGANMVPPYDDTRIIAGQGTAALELIDQVPGLDMVLAPVGGGGLLAGTCIAARKSQPHIRVIAAEPAGADDAWQSFRAGHRIPLTHPDTIADGLRTSVGHLNWPIIRRHVERVVTVTDAEIVAAMRMFWMLTKCMIEPSSAVPVAALLQKSFFASALPERSATANPSTGKLRIGVIISGGNVDLDNLPW